MALKNVAFSNFLSSQNLSKRWEERKKGEGVVTAFSVHPKLNFVLLAKV